MPKILERLVSQLRAKGKTKSSAFAIATSALQKSGSLRPGTQQPTAKGVRRGNMTPSQRAKDRQSKYSGNSSTKYKYSSKTNRATKK